MGKTKTAEPAEITRRSKRVLAQIPKISAVETKKRAPPKKAAKAKKAAKPAENGGTKAEEPKAEATEAK
ncbi:unnamed protein product [Ophioblennius macclurei]